MGRLLNPILGDPVGKIGGLIFQNSPSGTLIRSIHLPMKNNSQAQNQSRMNLRAINNIWNALEYTDKQNWNTFAVDGFAPLRKQNIGQYNGRSAFVSLNSVIIDNNRKLGDQITFGILPDYGGIGCNQGTLPLNATDNSYSISSFVYSEPGVYYPIKFITNNLIGILNSDPPHELVTVRLQCEIGWYGIDPSGLVSTTLKDSNGHILCFRIYMSTPVKFENAKPSTKLKNCLWSSGIITPNSGDYAGSDSISLSWDLLDTWKLMKKTPLPGQWIVFTLVSMGENGSCAICDEKYFQYYTTT